MSSNIFLTKLSEISGDRFDPLMVLYKKTTQAFKYDTVSFKDLLEEFVDANTIPSNPRTTTDEYTYHLNKIFDDMIAIIEEKRALVNSLKKWELYSKTVTSKVKEKSKKQKSKKVSKK